MRDFTEMQIQIVTPISKKRWTSVLTIEILDPPFFIQIISASLQMWNFVLELSF